NGARERDTARPDERAPEPRIARRADRRIQSRADEPRNGEEQAHLRVVEREVVTDQRPAGAQRSVDELVEELDREQKRKGAAQSAAARDLTGCAGHDHEILASASRTSSR